MGKKLIIGFGILLAIVVGILVVNYSGKNRDFVNESQNTDSSATLQNDGNVQNTGDQGQSDSGASFEEQYYQNLEEFFNGEENGYENIY